jgi:hypothetical protein
MAEIITIATGIFGLAFAVALFLRSRRMKREQRPADNREGPRQCSIEHRRRHPQEGSIMTDTAHLIDAAIGILKAFGDDAPIRNKFEFADIAITALTAYREEMGEPVGYVRADGLSSLANGRGSFIYPNADGAAHKDIPAPTPLYLSPPDASALAEENRRLREALAEAKVWHEEQDKALSKQPPSSGPNGTQWARHQHREQIDNINAALAKEPTDG